MFMLITIPIFLAFIFVPLITARQQGYSINYNSTTTVGDYIVKITNAAYITDTEEFKFTYNHKLSDDAGITKQSISISYLYFQYSEDDDYVDKTKEFKDDNLNSYTDLITAAEIKNDIKYVTIFLMIDIPEYQEEDTADEFGNPIQGEFHEREYKEIKFRIGKENIKSMTKNEYENTLKSIESITSETEIDTVESKNSTEKITQETTTTLQNRVPAPMPTTTQRPESSSKIDDNSESKSTTKKSDYHNNDEHQPDNDENDGQDYNDKNDYYNNNNERQPNDNQITEAPQTTTQATTQRPVYTTTTTQKSTVYVTGIRLDTGFTGNNVMLSVGNSHNISAVITPDNADNKNVYWSTNRSDIAVVDSNGKITAVGTGKAIITAATEDGGLTASCMVTVS